MTTLPSDAQAGIDRSRVELTALQVAWLTEIGMERPILARYRAASVPDAPSPGRTPEPMPENAAMLPLDADVGSADRLDAGGPELARMALKRARMPQARHAAPASASGQPAVTMHRGTPAVSDRSDMPSDWTALAAHAAACQVCELQMQRDQLVFGTGDTDQPDWLIVGEAPGKADDRTGLPFQGKAGKLLHAMLVAVGSHPSSVVLGGAPQPTPAWSQPRHMYFANLIKCRPLGNRSPTPFEIASCTPYLMQQIDLLQPRRIVAMGRLAAQALLQADADVDALRGRVHQLTTASGATIPLVVTWHPAALLMHPQNKGQAWADLNLAKRL